jgi:hypothetical protein
MRSDIAGNVKLLTQSVGVINAFGQVFQLEIVVSDSQAIAWLAGVHRIRAIGECVFHIFKSARRRE